MLDCLRESVMPTVGGNGAALAKYLNFYVLCGENETKGP